MPAILAPADSPRRGSLRSVTLRRANLLGVFDDPADGSTDAADGHDEPVGAAAGAAA
jgi:hypothetical protein